MVGSASTTSELERTGTFDSLERDVGECLKQPPQIDEACFLRQWDAAMARDTNGEAWPEDTPLATKTQALVGALAECRWLAHTAPVVFDSSKLGGVVGAEEEWWNGGRRGIGGMAAALKVTTEAIYVVRSLPPPA